MGMMQELVVDMAVKTSVPCHPQLRLLAVDRVRDEETIFGPRISVGRVLDDIY